jgi:alpha-ketoglutarate-dependent taurine dioxygenase
MRYTARKRSIIWKNDKTVEHALAFLHEILQGNPYLFRYRLSAGEGVISNNVLHNRSAITDSSSADEKRLLYRARFYNRVKKCDEEQDLQDVVNQ